MTEETKTIDTIKPEARPVGPLTADSSSLLKIEVTDNKIPPRDTLWYVCFTVIFLGLNALFIYQRDWSLVFFIVAAAGVTLWRGHSGRDMTLEIGHDGIKVNSKSILFDQIESFHFAMIGDDATLVFLPVKKHLPRITLILMDDSKVGKIREYLGDKVPETQTRDENIIDFVIRKLKL